MGQINKKLPLVVIFGRANVGKSTLFNTLIEKRIALTANLAGTTRDANIADVNWQKKSFTLVDTGGIVDLKYLGKNDIKTDEVDTLVQMQARKYLLQADLILFLVDSREGLLPTDKQMVLLAKKITQNKKTIILVANKADNPRIRQTISDFNQLGLGEPIPISAANGSGTGDLLDIINKKLPTPTVSSDIPLQPSIKVAIIGKPNVGKSSLINSLLGEDRIIVSREPHTTREPQNIEINYQQNNIELVDTAGISRQGQRSARRLKSKNTLEKFSIKKSLNVIRSADIALLIMDISQDLGHQELKLVEEIIRTKTGLILIANKWDLIKKRDTKVYTEIIRRHFPFARWTPILFTSALTGAKVNKILDLIIAISGERQKKISDSMLNKFLSQIIKKHRPSKGRGKKPPHIYELKQTKVNPPGFTIRVGAKDSLHDSYIHYIENHLREKFGFTGTPLIMYVGKNRRIHGQHEAKNILKQNN